MWLSSPDAVQPAAAGRHLLRGQLTYHSDLAVPSGVVYPWFLAVGQVRLDRQATAIVAAPAHVQAVLLG